MRNRDPRKLLPMYRKIEELQKQVDLLKLVAAEHNAAFAGQYQINKHLLTTTNRIEAKWN